ncbi:MAG: DUF4124 domain-containing protein [Proteobacteria bacterium]|nr:DUF4124 domain-containing protein [Pseudomonadota bacterium]
MLSPGERIALGGLAALAIAGAAAAWWTAEQWTPHAAPWAAQMWRKATRPGPDTLPRDKTGRPAPAAQSVASAPMVQPRKCVSNGQVTYTDQACPPGSRELAVDGAVTSLPAH